jgi:hypothetical protein
VVTQTDYINTDTVNAQYSSVTGSYLIDFVADTITEDSGDTTHSSCSYASYDGAPFATGPQSALTLGEATSTTSRSQRAASPARSQVSGGLRPMDTEMPRGEMVCPRWTAWPHPGCTTHGRSPSAPGASDASDVGAAPFSCAWPPLTPVAREPLAAGELVPLPPFSPLALAPLLAA